MMNVYRRRNDGNDIVSLFELYEIYLGVDKALAKEYFDIIIAECYKDLFSASIILETLYNMETDKSVRFTKKQKESMKKLETYLFDKSFENLETRISDENGQYVIMSDSELGKLLEKHCNQFARTENG